MGYINGEIRILYLKKDSVYHPIGCLTSNSFSENVETIDTTTRENNGWKTARPTSQSYNISFDGLILDSEDATKITYNDLKVFKRGRSLIEWKIDGFTVDEEGSGYINSLSESDNIDEFVSFNGSITGQNNPIT